MKFKQRKQIQNTTYKTSVTVYLAEILFHFQELPSQNILDREGHHTAFLILEPVAKLQSHVHIFMLYLTLGSLMLYNCNFKYGKNCTNKENFDLFKLNSYSTKAVLQPILSAAGLPQPHLDDQIRNQQQLLYLKVPV